MPINGEAMTPTEPPELLADREVQGLGLKPRF
jgi:hypothetical protein